MSSFDWYRIFVFGFVESVCHGSEADEGAVAELEIAFGLEGRWRRWFSTNLREEIPGNYSRCAMARTVGATACSLRKP